MPDAITVALFASVAIAVAWICWRLRHTPWF